MKAIVKLFGLTALSSSLIACEAKREAYIEQHRDDPVEITFLGEDDAGHNHYRIVDDRKGEYRHRDEGSNMKTVVDDADFSYAVTELANQRSVLSFKTDGKAMLTDMTFLKFSGSPNNHVFNASIHLSPGQTRDQLPKEMRKLNCNNCP